MTVHSSITQISRSMFIVDGSRIVAGGTHLLTDLYSVPTPNWFNRRYESFPSKFEIVFPPQPIPNPLLGPVGNVR